MSTNLLSEAEAWRFLAQKWENAEPRPHGYEIGPMVAGLCDSVRYHRSPLRNLVSKRTTDAMLQRLDVFDPSGSGRGWFFWPLTSEGANERATACGLLAAMADDEGRDQ